MHENFERILAQIFPEVLENILNVFSLENQLLGNIIQPIVNLLLELFAYLLCFLHSFGQGVLCFLNSLFVLGNSIVTQAVQLFVQTFYLCFGIFQSVEMGFAVAVEPIHAVRHISHCKVTGFGKAFIRFFFRGISIVDILLCCLVCRQLCFADIVQHGGVLFCRVG